MGVYIFQPLTFQGLGDFIFMPEKKIMKPLAIKNKNGKFLFGREIETLLQCPP